MYKNVASQTWTVFAFDRTTNDPKTGDAANITAKIKIDGGAAGATDDTNPTELESGYYEFDLTQAETNGNLLRLIPVSATGDIQVIGLPGAIYTVDVDAFADALLKRDFSSVTGEAARSALNALRWLRNKWSISGSTLTVTKEDDSTEAWTATVTGDSGADPIVGSDPA